MDTTIIKVDSTHSPHGPLGQLYLVTGVGVGMRLWRDRPPGPPKPEVARDYETVGYVISGRAELHSEGQMVLLEPGNAWVVPRHARPRSVDGLTPVRRSALDTALISSLRRSGIRRGSRSDGPGRC